MADIVQELQFILQCKDLQKHYAIQVSVIDLASKLPEVASHILSNAAATLPVCDDALCLAQLEVLKTYTDDSGLQAKV